MTPGRASPRRQRGFVLVIVLWTVALLALVAGHITAGARASLAQATALRDGAVAGATADGLAREAIFHLLDASQNRWTADAIPRRVTFPRGTGEVVVSNEAGRINPNMASPDLLTSLLLAAGVPRTQARLLGTAIYEWHVPAGVDPAKYRAAHLPYGPPGKNLADAADLGFVVGMTPEIMARIGPELSVHNDGHIDLDAASALVRRAVVGMPPEQRPQAPEPGGAAVLRIVVHAVLPHAEARREIVVRIDLSEDDPLACCEIVAWKQ